MAAARKLVAAADLAAQPNARNPDGTQASWLLSEGVMGTGEKPSWFKSDKYKNVAAQAEAYAHLESRFGSFTGAPKNEKGEVAYTFTPPEGFNLNQQHPLIQTFNKWAGDNQLSQEGYTQLLGQLLQYEQAQAPTMDRVKAAVGPDVDGRISGTVAWTKANVGAEGLALLRDATSIQGVTQENRIAATFKLVEMLINKSGQVRMPKPGADVPQAGGDALEAIKRDHGAKLPDGRLRINVEPAYRLEIDKRYREYFAAQSQG